MRGTLVLALSYSGIVLAQQGKWYQCGGQNWSGGTSCTDGWTCQVQNPYYSQCLPPSGGQSGGQSSGGDTSGGQTGGQSTGGDTSGGGSDQTVEASQEVTNNNGNIQSNGFTSTASASATSPTGGQTSGGDTSGGQVGGQSTGGQSTGGHNAKSGVDDDDFDDDTCDTETEDETEPATGSSPITQAQTQPKDGKSGVGNPVIGTPGNNDTSTAAGDSSQSSPGTSSTTGDTSQSSPGTSSTTGDTSQSNPGTSTGNQGGSTDTGPAAAGSTEKVDGKFPDNLATTTNYDSGTGPGACGCSGRWQSPGSGTVMTAAASFPIYGDGYCGSGCGKCFKLTNMGYGPVANSGADPSKKGDTIIVMITNSCPVEGNEQWCSSPNQYGYTSHFDIASMGQSPNGWGNVVVSFEPVGCGMAGGGGGGGGLVENYGQCKCAAQRPASTRKRGVKSRWAAAGEETSSRLRLASLDDLEEF